MLRYISMTRLLYSRSLSNLATPYGNGAAAAAGNIMKQKKKKITLREIYRLYTKKIPITMITGVDYPSAKHIDNAGFDILLVGDSLGMTTLGMETTLAVTTDDMIHHTKAVVRAAKHPLIVTDMPFGSCEGNRYETLKNAQRIINETGTDAVKIEGGKNRANTIRTLVDAGIPVMGHVGLQPQMVNVLGGFISQGKTALEGKKIIEDAVAVQNAGAFSIVLECIPSVLSGVITEILKVPTIGIGAGPKTSGQVLVYNDLVGMTATSDKENWVPKFCKRYGQVGKEIEKSLRNYKDEVQSGVFPSEEYSPYKISLEEEEKLHELQKQYQSQDPVSDTMNQNFSIPTNKIKDGS